MESNHHLIVLVFAKYFDRAIYSDHFFLYLVKGAMTAWDGAWSIGSRPEIAVSRGEPPRKIQQTSAPPANLKK